MTETACGGTGKIVRKMTPVGYGLHRFYHSTDVIDTGLVPQRQAD
jgi:hypothetical protein